MNKILLLLLFPCFLRAQTGLPDSVTQKIDRLFGSYNDKTPGAAVAIMKDTQVVFQKGYGMANLEYSIPITPTTIFHIASESKQYVAFCILLLEKQGKLHLDDDIRKWLDYIPDFGHKITILHLIYHMSGLRDQWQLLANAGWQLDDVITQEHVIKLISKQKALNFVPGEEFLYCNTGYTLLAEIVKKVSGQTLREFADKNIFQPLGMTDTHFNDNYEEIVPHRAYSYSMGPGKYENAVLSYSIVGATSLLTTVLDELKWEKNYQTAQVGGRDVIEKMHRTGVLNDGRKLNYAFAISLDRYKGWQIIGHGGADAGFRTYACRIPEKGLSIVVFSNLGSANPNFSARAIAGILIPDEKPEQKPAPPATYADSNLCKKMVGRYYSERGTTGEYYWQNGKLFCRGLGLPTGGEVKLSPAGNNRYATAANDYFVKLDENSSVTDSIRTFTLIGPVNSISFKRLPVNYSFSNKDFTGRYYGDETEAYYSITEKDGTLMLEHRKFSTVPLRNIAPDQFTSSNWWMDHIHFLRDASGKVIAFEVNAGRIQHLKYDRVN